jgi:glycosyltransferase involved in cell wall biosynthesis
LERSLTILLPVHDAPSNLGTTVRDLLDVLPEMTEQFEVLIVDDGSVEAVSETAHDLSRSFPQVRVVHQGSVNSREAAIRTGLARSAGEVVMLDEGGSSIRIDDVHRVWEAMKSQDLQRPSRRAVAAIPSRVSRADGLRVIQKTAPEAADQGPVRCQEDELPPKRPKYLRRIRDFAFGE